MGSARRGCVAGEPPAREAPHSSRPVPVRSLGPAPACRSRLFRVWGKVWENGGRKSPRPGNAGLPHVTQAEGLLGETALLLPFGRLIGAEGDASALSPSTPEQRLAEPPPPEGAPPAETGARPRFPAGLDPAPPVGARPQSCFLFLRPGVAFRVFNDLRTSSSRTCSSERCAFSLPPAPRRRRTQHPQQRPLLGGAPRTRLEAEPALRGELGAASPGRSPPGPAPPAFLVRCWGRWWSCRLRCFWGTPERKGGPLQRRARESDLEE